MFQLMFYSANIKNPGTIRNPGTRTALRTGRRLPIRYVRRIPSSAYMSITAISVEVDRMENRGGAAA